MSEKANVHEYDDAGNTQFAVCHWDDFHSQWQRPLDGEEARLTSCHTEGVFWRVYY